MGFIGNPLKQGLSGTLSNCLPISIEFLLGTPTVEVNRLPAEEAQEQLSQRFEKLQDENLKAIQDEVNKLSRIEQTQMVIEKKRNINNITEILEEGKCRNT